MATENEHNSIASGTASETVTINWRTLFTARNTIGDQGDKMAEEIRALPGVGRVTVNLDPRAALLEVELDQGFFDDLRRSIESITNRNSGPN